MSIETIKDLIEKNNIISFYKVSSVDADRGNFVCRIENCKDSLGKHQKGDCIYYLYADTFEDLLNKIERKYSK